jgi:hypothetical protein
MTVLEQESKILVTCIAANARHSERGEEPLYFALTCCRKLDGTNQEAAMTSLRALSTGQLRDDP